MTFFQTTKWCSVQKDTLYRQRTHWYSPLEISLKVRHAVTFLGVKKKKICILKEYSDALQFNLYYVCSVHARQESPHDCNEQRTKPFTWNFHNSGGLCGRQYASMQTAVERLLSEVFVKLSLNHLSFQGRNCFFRGRNVCYYRSINEMGVILLSSFIHLQ